jgi:hypothetical protein
MDLNILINIGFYVKLCGVLKISPKKLLTTLGDQALSWYMKFFQGTAPKPMNVIKIALIVEFKKPKSVSQCIIEIKEIKKRIVEPMWEFD